MGVLNNVVVGFKNLLTGKETPTEKKRILTCQGCKHFTKGKNHWCGKCPCYMPAKVKAPGAKCPIRKW